MITRKKFDTLDQMCQWCADELEYKDSNFLMLDNETNCICVDCFEDANVKDFLEKM